MDNLYPKSGQVLAIMLLPTNLLELFRTPYGVVYQCNRRNCYWVEFAGSMSPFKMQDFRLLKQQLELIDVSEMVCNTNRAADIAIIMPYRSERCFVLTLTDVLHFRELLQGAKAMIELNSILSENLYLLQVA